MTAEALHRRLPSSGRPGVAVSLGIAAPFLAPPLAVLATYRPAYALALAIGGVAVILCVLRVDIALLALVAAAPLESAVKISSNPALSITKILGLICFTSFALYAVGARHKVLLDRSHAIVFLLVAVALVSTLQAREINPAITTSVRYLSFVALYLVVSQFLGSEVMQRRLAWVLSAASALAGAQALYNFLGKGNALTARPSYGDPNDLAFLLATSLPITLWLLRERGLRRIAVIAMVALTLTAIVFTFSRGALVGLAAGAIWYFATERKHLRILVVAGALAAAASYGLVQSNPSQFELGFKAKESVAGVNVKTRLDAWSVASRLAAEQPILGVGPGNFRNRYPEATDQIVTTDTPQVVHNAYLDIAAELGFVGLFLFLAYLAESFSRLSAAKRHGYGLPGFASAVRTGLVVAMVSALFLSEQYYAPFWLLGGIATGLWMQNRRGIVTVGDSAKA